MATMPVGSHRQGSDDSEYDNAQDYTDNAYYEGGSDMDNSMTSNYNRVGREWPVGVKSLSTLDNDPIPAPTTTVDDEDDEPEMTIESVVEAIGTMKFNLSRILDCGQNLNADALEEVRDLLHQISYIYEQLEDGKQMMDDRNDVDALIDFNHLKWSWDNEHVDYYRAASQLNDHPQYNAWHYPEFFSDNPLPEPLPVMIAQISLPPGTGTQTKHTKVQVTKRHTVSGLIRNALEKKDRGVIRDDEVNKYVLKAEGFHQFLRPGKNFADYEFVRRNMRDGVEKIQFKLIPTPKAIPDVEPYISELKNDYISKIKSDINPIDEKTYQDIPPLPWHSMTHTPMSKVELPLRFRICGLDNLDEKSLPIMSENQFTHIQIETFLFHGVEKYKHFNFLTKKKPLTSTPRWMTWFMAKSLHSSETLISALPRNARLGFILYGEEQSKTKSEGKVKTQETKSKDPKEKGKVHRQQLAYFVLQLVDFSGKLTTGSKSLRMWPFPVGDKKHGKKHVEDLNFIFRATTRDNLASKHAVTLRVDFNEYCIPVVAPLEEMWRKPNMMKIGQPAKQPRTDEVAQIKKIKDMDPLTNLLESDQEMMWRLRNIIVGFPQLLPKFLRCVKWGIADYRFEAYSLLEKWAPQPTMVHILELLDVKYPDYRVRKYAVKYLSQMKDEELQLYLLQITQCLKFEPYHVSPLSRFLIRRAIANPYCIGHYFFWHLKAELHNSPDFSERYAMILEEYLSHCGRFAGELRKQNNAVLKMQRVSTLIVRLKREDGHGDDYANKEYRKELKKLNKTFFLPMGKFQIPLDPKWEAKSLIIEKCRYMSSKMVPLWLVFKNADEKAPPIYIIFKSGDDLRQDILTLQLIRVMDKLWLEEGLNMKLRPYRVVATGVNEHGDGVGMLEIVLNSDTTSGIQLKYYGAMGALKMDPIALFLNEHNTGEGKYQEAKENFIASCAGYCVATFVLGIGDRHNGNIMVTKDGHLFHIDFGHFLGNFKKKFGINRERAAFVLTPEMAYVMGGRQYKSHHLFKKFRDLCTKAYRILRSNAAILEILFILMVSARMPELLVEEDIVYMQEKLYLDYTEEEANKFLQDEITKSLGSAYRRFDNMIHNFKHG